MGRAARYEKEKIRITGRVLTGKSTSCRSWSFVSQGKFPLQDIYYREFCKAPTTNYGLLFRKSWHLLLKYRP